MRKTRDRGARSAAVVAALLLALAPAAAAQQGSPLSNFVVSGYATAGYTSALESQLTNDFDVSLSPIVLYNLGDDVLFETELEISVEGGDTEINLEYAQIDLLVFEHVQVVAGKFLLPFGVFSERLHPSWINKLPSMPLLYGHAHGGMAEGALLPVLSDVGLMGRLGLPLGERLGFELSAFVTQGPRLVEQGEEGEAEDGHAHSVLPLLAAGADPTHDEDGAAGAVAFTVPSVAFGTSFADNNDSKLVGARLGLVRGAAFALYLSGFHSMYDAEDFLDLTGGNVAAEFRTGPVELRGEGAVLWQEFARDGAFPTLTRPGYYVQASRTIGDFEPVVRWSHLLDATVEGDTFREETRQVAFGLNYWIRPSFPVKAAFEVNLDGDERLLFQWAYGF